MVLFNSGTRFLVPGHGPQKMNLDMPRAKELRRIEALLLPLLVAPTPTPQLGSSYMLAKGYNPSQPLISKAIEEGE